MQRLLLGCCLFRKALFVHWRWPSSRILWQQLTDAIMKRVILNNGSNWDDKKVGRSHLLLRVWSFDLPCSCLWLFCAKQSKCTLLAGLSSRAWQLPAGPLRKQHGRWKMSFSRSRLRNKAIRMILMEWRCNCKGSKESTQSTMCFSFNKWTLTILII